MAFHVGLGPVFKYEWLATTRRWQLYALRSFFVAMILAAIAFMWLIWNEQQDEIQGAIQQKMALLGSLIYWAMVFTQITMVLLVAPAATAGSVCLDKARGTLDHMLATELSNSEIVLGKLGVRMVPLLGIVLSLLPAMILTCLLGGVDPNGLIGAFLVTVGIAAFACTLAFTLSVWGTKVHEVLFAAYFILLAWILAAPFGFVLGILMRSPAISHYFYEIAKFTNPYYLALAPYTQPGVVGYETWFTFLAGCLAVSAFLTTLSTMCIRRICLSQAGKSSSNRDDTAQRARTRWKFWARGPRWSFPAPSLDGNPVLWREWQRTKPSRWMRIIWGVYGVTGLILTAFVLVEALQRSGRQYIMAMLVIVFLVNVGLFLLNVQAVTSLSEERIRGSLDILLSTPITTFAVLVGKWLGVWRILPKLMILPAIVSGIMVMDSNRWTRWVYFLLLISSYGASAISLGIACATRISRLGRAIAVSIGFSVLYNILVLLTFFVCSSVGNVTGLGYFASLAAPLSGAGVATISLFPMTFGVRPEMESMTTTLAAWCLIQYLFSAILFLATWGSFNHCMGRSSSRRILFHRPGPTYPKPSPGLPQTVSR